MYYKSILYKKIRGIKLSKIYHLKQYFPTDVLLCYNVFKICRKNFIKIS